MYVKVFELYWNRKFFFLYIYKRFVKVKLIIFIQSFDIIVFALNEWAKKPYTRSTRKKKLVVPIIFMLYSTIIFDYICDR